MTAGALCVGLPDASRTKRRLSGMKLSLQEMLLAIIADGINLLIWQNTKDGARGRHRPDSLFKKLTEDKKKKDELEVFDDSDAFNEWYQKRIKHG